jgi:hypothetical protein
VTSCHSCRKMAGPTSRLTKSSLGSKMQAKISPLWSMRTLEDHLSSWLHTVNTTTSSTPAKVI